MKTFKQFNEEEELDEGVTSFLIASTILSLLLYGLDSVFRISSGKSPYTELRDKIKTHLEKHRLEKEDVFKLLDEAKKVIPYLPKGKQNYMKSLIRKLYEQMMYENWNADKLLQMKKELKSYIKKQGTAGGYFEA